MINYKFKLYLIVILTLAIFFRLYNLNWDQGFHLHPDERAITMFTLPLEIPKNISQFLSEQSSWNPHFFAYGSFPLYLLKITANIIGIFDPLFTQYDKINLPGRFLSAIFDVGTLIIVFLLGKKIFNKKIGLLASFFYGISVLPIQLSHFYAVDTLLTFFIILTLYNLIIFYEKPSFIKAIFIGITFGFALATKISATVLIVSIGLTIVIDFFLVFIKNPHRPKIWLSHLPKILKKLFTEGIIILFITFITFIILEPYALIDFKTFLQHNIQQRQMTYDAFTFPYTLQYVGKISYFYELKNIFLWGQGPILAFISFIGTLFVSYKAIKQVNNKIIIILVFFWAYFLIVGNFAIGFMRYMLPLYPLLCLFGSFFAWQLLKFFQNKFSHSQFSTIRLYPQLVLRIVEVLIVLALLVWPFSFIDIYTRSNTRVLASEWIYKNIPSDKTLAVEHWDDQLPLGGSTYQTFTLPLYDPDTSFKWENINQQLKNTDYLIIASNRLYTPLQKLIDCQRLPIDRCYPITSAYYKKLLHENLGFKKVAEFSSYPKLSIFNFQFSINDSSADESFTVYDHPKIIIFKRD